MMMMMMIIPKEKKETTTRTTTKKTTLKGLTHTSQKQHNKLKLLLNTLKANQ
jgi:hypothetical protein